MAAGTLICDGDVTVAADGAPLCNGVWTLVPVPAPFEVAQLDPVQMGLAVVLGFSLYTTLGVVSFSVRYLYHFVQKHKPF
jgi:hypothetical protein